MEGLTPIEELRAIAEKEIAQEKSITDLSASDIKLSLDHKKSVEEQAEDISFAMATAKAVSDESTAKDLTEKKAEELKAKASAKEKKAETESIEATTEKQEAERRLYEAVLETFGIFKHLPKWLMKTLVMIFSPIYVFLNLLIGVPCGFVKVLIINIDGILIRYESADEKRQPKIRMTVLISIILLVLAVVAGIVYKILEI